MLWKRIGASALVCALLAWAGAGLGEEIWYLRVIGRDDTASGQEEKIRVRNAALSACPENLADMGETLTAIQRAAERLAPCRVEIRLWRPDEKTPAAPTVYITVGEGRGHNWWGLLYKNALLLSRMDTEETDAETDGAVIFEWPILEAVLRWLGITGN